MNLTKELEAKIEKNKQHNNALVLGMTITTEVAVSLEESGETEKLESLEACIREYIELEARVGKHIAALAEVKDKIPEVLDQDDGPELTDLFKQILGQYEKQTEASLKKHPKYRDFRLKVWRVHHPNEALPEEQNSDLVVMSQKNDEYICPLTKITLVNPMKNRNCGHYYSKTAILEFLKSARQKGCPVAGCSALITKSTLEDDLDLERRIRRMQKKKKKQSDEDEAQSAEDL